MYIADQILDFYRNLKPPDYLPDGVEVMNPYNHKNSWEYVKTFYQKFYPDNRPRTLLIGINPGRFGGGITGIPFTDPIRLKENCGIDNDLVKKPELSSQFIYEVISAAGSPEAFYAKYYITAVSPLGFMKNGKNLNYYDLPDLQANWEPFMVHALQMQVQICGNREVAFSVGMGKNIRYLEYLNGKYTIFDTLKSLPHPRWVMQYRLKRKEEFIRMYRNLLGM